MIYLDHHAATPLCSRAEHAMRAAEEHAWANPASVHRAGQRARAVLEEARSAIARGVGAAPADVVLTSGGTEAVNLAVRGLAKEVTRVVRTHLAHPALDRAIRALSLPTVFLDTPAGEAPDDERVAAHLGAGALLAASWVNHETGTILPIERWAGLCRDAGARLAVDGSQALGKLPVDCAALGATTIAFAAPKIGGPAGAGALVVERGIDLEPVLGGGGQERGRRPGSPDIVAAAGFGGACDVLAERLEAQPAVAALRDRLEAHLVARGASINAGTAPRVATVTNVSLDGIRGDEWVAALDVEGVAAASGAACSSGVVEASPVVAAMYPDEPWRARSTLRLTLGPENRPEEIDRALAAIDVVLERFAAHARTSHDV